MKKIKIYQCVANQVCAPYRLILPSIELNKLDDIEVKQIQNLNARTLDEVYQEANIVIIQRQKLSNNLLQIIHELNKREIIVVYEIDDDLINIDPESRYAFTTSDDFSVKVRECIASSQCIQCSTRSLAESLISINTEAAVLENQLDFVAPFSNKSNNKESIVVGYAAGNDHFHDWQNIREVYNKIISELKHRNINIETWIIGDQAIFDSINSARKRFFPMLPKHDYLKFISNLDISIIPLKNNKFNQSKSDIKYLELLVTFESTLA